QLSVSVAASINRTLPSLSIKLNAISDSLIRNSIAPFLPPVVHPSIPPNTSIPDIDYVSVDLDKKKGIHDSFVATVVFSVPRSQVAAGKVNAIRIFRSEAINPDFARKPGQLSVKGMEILSSDTNRSRSKNQDYLALYETFLRQNSVQNAVSS